jgi:hypothetical protein
VDQIATFLQSIFGGKPEDLVILIWLLDGKRSLWCSSVEEAVRAASSHADQDVYVGVGLAPPEAKSWGPHRRCDAGTIVGLPGLWIDVDWASPVHAKSNLPPNEDAALGLIAAMGPRPTVLVRTGHGIQAWWLFHEIWIFEHPGDWARAADAIIRWQATLRARAEARGWTVDATHDLARVLRVPGTTNTKAKPVPVDLLLHDGPRYELSDLEGFMVEMPSVVPKRECKHGGHEVELRPDADIRSDQLETLRMFPDFVAIWDKKRKDMKDDSQSAYDLALANWLKRYGVDDQQIANAIIAFRRRHQAKPEKALRKDYMQRLLCMAADQIGLDADVKKELAIVEDSDGNPLEFVSKTFGFKVYRLYKLEGMTVINNNEDYHILSTEKGNIRIPNLRMLYSQSEFRRKIGSLLDVYIPPIRAKDYEICLKILTEMKGKMSAAEFADEQDTDSGTINELFSELWSTSRASDNPSRAYMLHVPFVYEHGGRKYLCLFSSTLRQQLKLRMRWSGMPTDLATMLKEAGYTRFTVHVKVGSQWTTASAWGRELPDGYAAAGPVDTGPEAG